MADGQIQARVAIAGLLGFALALAALHAIDRATIPRHVSGFVKMEGGWLWTAALVALSTALIALGAALRRTLPPDPDGRLGAWLITGAGVLAMAMIAFQTDDTQLTSGPLARTPSGWVHNLAAVFGTTLQGAAMLVLVDAGRRNRAWGRVAGTTFTLPVCAIVLGFAWGLGDLSPYWVAAAIIQRLLVLTMVGWMLGVAWRLQAVGATGTAGAETDSALAAAEERFRGASR